ncbi:MAG: hypothetical protein QXV81_06905 [Ignisphaera sp.]
MIRKSFCELFIKIYSTPIRVAIALNLIERYSFSQLQAAKAVGLPQPLLNYVIKGRRRLHNLERVLGDGRVSKIVDELTDEIASGLELDMCSICTRFREHLDLPKPQYRLK